MVKMFDDEVLLEENQKLKIDGMWSLLDHTSLPEVKVLEKLSDAANEMVESLVRTFKVDEVRVRCHGNQFSRVSMVSFGWFRLIFWI